MMNVLGWVRRHIVWVGGAAVAVIAIVLLVFQPQKLFIDQTVTEALPSASPSASVSASPGPQEPTVLARGSFRSLEHHGTGKALAVRLADGRRIIRLEDLDVENGPDLFVYLSSTAATARDDDDFNRDFVNLGRLKGNRGDHNYRLPARVDLSKYRSVVIWCRRFSSGFAVAGLA